MTDKNVANSDSRDPGLDAFESKLESDKPLFDSSDPVDYTAVSEAVHGSGHHSSHHGHHHSHHSSSSSSRRRRSSSSRSGAAGSGARVSSRSGSSRSGSSRSGSSRHHSSSRRRRKGLLGWFGRHKVVTAFIGAFAIFALILSGALAWLFFSLGRPETISNVFPDESTRPAAAQTTKGKPVTFLLLGSDSRISAGNPSDWKVGAQRTDAIMLVQLSGDRKSANVMSIPRDSWVEIPANDVVGHASYAKINAAFSWGGPKLLIQTVEKLTQIRIDHFVLADFSSFEALTDELGGVDLTLSQPLDLTGKQNAANSANVLPAGPQHLNGKQARIFVQERYTVARGDFDRIQRQQAWMRAILKALVNRDTLTDPGKLVSFVNVVTKNLAVDEGLTTSEMVSLGRSASSIRPADVHFFQAPVTGTGTSDDGQSIVNLDRDRLTAVCRAFNSDTVSEYVSQNGKDLDMLQEVVR